MTCVCLSAQQEDTIPTSESLPTSSMRLKSEESTPCVSSETTASPPGLTPSTTPAPNGMAGNGGGGTSSTTGHRSGFSNSSLTVDATGPPPAISKADTPTFEPVSGEDINESALHETIQMLDHSVLQLDEYVLSRLIWHVCPVCHGFVFVFPCALTSQLG